MPATGHPRESFFDRKDLEAGDCPVCPAKAGEPCVSLLQNVRPGQGRALKGLHTDRVNAAINAGAKTSTQKWSDLIQQQGERARQRDDETLAEAQALLPSQKAQISELTSKDLVTQFRSFACRGFHDPRLTAVTQELADAYEAEILERLSNG
jgi:hypothetical protein